jgi:predicted ATPase
VRLQAERADRIGQGRAHRWTRYRRGCRAWGWSATLKQQGKPDEAEETLRTGIEVARQQRAKSWELRIATTLATLMKEQGRRERAFDLLHPVYDWFTEGFDTRDLIEAKALLDDL